MSSASKLVVGKGQRVGVGLTVKGHKESLEGRETFYIMIVVVVT